MKTNQIKAEVYNLEGMKVMISRDFNHLDLSKLVDDVYMISYLDSDGNVLWTERYVKETQHQHAYNRI